MNSTKNKLNSSKNKLNIKKKKAGFLSQSQTQPQFYKISIFAKFERGHS